MRCGHVSGAQQFATLIQAYYDDAIEDRHMKKGGKDARFGFGQCGWDFGRPGKSGTRIRRTRNLRLR